MTGVAQSALATFAGITATGEVIAGGLFDTIKSKMQLVVDKLAEWQNNGSLQLWADNATKAFQSFMTIATPIADQLINFGKWIFDNWNLIAPVLAGIIASFLTFSTAIKVIELAKIAMTAFNVIMAANPIVLVTLAVAALVAAGVALYMNWDTVKTKAGELWKSIKEIFAGIKASVGNLWEEAKEWGANIVKGIGEGIADMGGWIKDKVLGFCNKIGSTVKNFFGIESPSKLMTEYGGYVAGGFAKGIKEGTKEVADKATAMANAVKGAMDTVLAGVTLSVNIAQAEFDKLKLKMGDTGSASELYGAQVNLLTTKINSQTGAIAIIQKSLCRYVNGKR